MKRKALLILLSLACALTCAIGLAACDDGTTDAHTHTWSKSWTSDATHHWHKCTSKQCSKNSGYAPHDFSNGTCICGKSYNEDLLEFEPYPYGGGYVITNVVDKAITELTLPASYKNQPVIEIGYMAFKDCRKLKSVTMPDSILIIAEFAFDGCINLTDVNMGKELVTIESCAFYGCISLTNITLPERVSNTKEDSFLGCPIITASFPATAMNSIPKALLTEATITGYYRISESAFEDCVTLKSLTIENRVPEIDSYAFRNCISLESVTIFDSKIRVNRNAFTNCPIKTAIIPASAINAVAVKSLTDVTITSGSEIPAYGFRDCTSLKNVILPNSITTISNYAFQNCSSLKGVILPNNVTTVGLGSFQGCSSLISIFIPTSVTTIGGAVFRYCTSLISITIPSSVTTIEPYAFQNCSNLTKIIFNGTVGQWNAIEKGYNWDSSTGNYTVQTN